MQSREKVLKIIEKYNNSFIAIAVTATYNTNVLKGKYKLQKDNSLDNIIILDSPTLFDNSYTIEDAKKQRPFSQEQIKNFVKQMEDNVAEKDLIAMYNNLHNLKIKESDLSLILMSIADRISMGVNQGSVIGYYTPTKNEIVVYSPNGERLSRKLFKSNDEITLEGEYTHELLHMSSTVRKKGQSCTGFNHYYIAPPANFSIGMGLNEGYTDLLNERIFNVKNEGGLYEIYKIVSELIENVIGKDKMTHLYFTADLKGLISELSKYISQSETKKFVINLDLMIDCPDKINEIIEYIFKLYNNKIQNEIATGKITPEESAIEYNMLKTKTIKLNETFNQWFETKIIKSENPLSNLDVNSILESQQLNSPSHSRGSINITVLFLGVCLISLLITIIYLLHL